MVECVCVGGGGRRLGERQTERETLKQAEIHLLDEMCTKSAGEMKSPVLTYFSEPEWQLSTPSA